MKTIYTILPIYDSLLKQDYNRTGAVIPIYTPRHRLPAWQYNVEAVAVGAVTRIDLVNSAGTLTNITTYFPTLSDDYALTTDTYYKYDGDTLNYLLPVGAYYLKITHDNGYIFYSEWFVVTYLYEQIVTLFTNIDYDNYLGSLSLYCEEVGVSGSCQSNTFPVRNNETIKVIFYHTQDSGQLPTLSLYVDGAPVDSDTVAAGLNEIDLTADNTGTAYLLLSNGAATEYETSEIYVIRAYALKFIRIDFSDTHDLGNILYRDGFSQTVWLGTRLNTPTHEPVEVGEEKNGIFIAEKIVTKYKYRIVIYVGPVLYRSLIRLPQHDTISITDEVGFTYTPCVGNIRVNPVNWNWFDTGTLEIVFNDNDEFVWTSENKNLS